MATPLNAPVGAAARQLRLAASSLNDVAGTLEKATTLAPGTVRAVSGSGLLRDTRYADVTVPDPKGENQQLGKYFVFNMTGNILLASTAQEPTIEKDVQAVFSEVAVFSAAMTAAMARSGKNLYDYDALDAIIRNSGLFVQVNKADVQVSTNSFGMQFGKDLLSGLLGLAIGGAAVPFISGLVQSLGDQVNINSSSQKSDARVGNLIFVCEYLLGMPIVSVISFYTATSEVAHQVQVGPCFSVTNVTTNWKVSKSMYTFVVPKWIQQYAGDILSPMASADYQQLIALLTSYISGQPVFTALNGPDGATAPEALTLGQTYVFIGTNLGTAEGKVSWGDGTATVAQWSNEQVKIQVTKGPAATAPIVLTTAAGQKVSTTMSYSAAKDNLRGKL